MKKIVVPVDFSDYAENALKTAVSIAKKNNAEIIAVHMMGLNQSVLTQESSSSIDALFYVKLTQKKFTEFLDKDFLDGVKIQQEVRNYTNFSEIDEIAREHSADLIVMGSHGSSGASEFFIGSNTEKVVRTATTPVLVIKDLEEFKISTAVFACDFTLESVEAYKKAMDIFKALEIKVKLVFINQPEEKFYSTKNIDNRLVDFIIHLKEYDFLPEDVTVYCDYSVESGLFNFSKKVKADMISIPTHGRRGLSHFFSGSIGEDVVNHSILPVLTVKI